MEITPPEQKSQSNNLTPYKNVHLLILHTHTQGTGSPPPNEATNNKTTDSQNKALDKGRQMAAILKGKLDQKKKYHSLWLVTAIKNRIKIPVKDIRLPVLSFGLTQEVALYNSNTLATFHGNLGKATKAQNRTPLEYGSSLQDINGIV